MTFFFTFDCKENKIIMKKALIVIGSFIALLLIVAALMPSTTHVERSIEINAPVDLVYDQVVDLKKNFNWSPWSEYDPEMKVEWGDITKGQNASYSWSGNSDVGSGTLTIAEIIENEFIRNDLDFGEMGKGSGTWKFESISAEGASDNMTRVTWGMDSELDWPVGRFFGLFMDGMVGPDFEKGLQKLKEVAEKLPVVPKIMVEETTVQEMTLISIKDSIAIDKIGVKMGESMMALVDFLQANDLEMTGAPICFYHVWNEEQGYTVMECALPIAADNKVNIKGNVSIKTFPMTSAAKAVHNGAYEDLAQYHYAIDEWINTNQRQITGAPFEVYLTDPQSEPDTSKWITEVYYPIQ